MKSCQASYFHGHTNLEDCILLVEEYKHGLKYTYRFYSGAIQSVYLDKKLFKNSILSKEDIVRMIEKEVETNHENFLNNKNQE